MKSVNEESRWLPEQLMAAYENERQRIVYDIHDGVAQYLAGAIMQIESAIHSDADISNSSHERLETAIAMLRGGLDEVREIISGVHPPILNELGIVAAIEHLIAEHRKISDGIRVTFNHSLTDSLNLSPLTSVTLFRVVQESLNNVRAHSNAKNAYVELTNDTNHVRLLIRDDGIGFDVSSERQDHVGLRGMHSRVESMDGELQVESHSRRGTTVVARLPIFDALQRESAQRSLAERRVRLSDERLALAFRATTDAIWECDLLTGRVSWNDGYNALFGERPPDTADSWQWWIDRIHPVCRAEVARSIRAAAESDPSYGDCWTASYRYRRVDGSYAFVSDRAFIARDKQGHPTRILGAMVELKDPPPNDESSIEE